MMLTSEPLAGAVWFYNLALSFFSGAGIQSQLDETAHLESKNFLVLINDDGEIKPFRVILEV